MRHGIRHKVNAETKQLRADTIVRAGEIPHRFIVAAKLFMELPAYPN
jgi:hypothetical protein